MSWVSYVPCNLYLLIILFLVCVCVCVYMFLKHHLSNTLLLMLDFFCIIRADDYFCAYFFLCCVSTHYERYHNHRTLIYSSITHLSLSHVVGLPNWGWAFCFVRFFCVCPIAWEILFQQHKVSLHPIEWKCQYGLLAEDSNVCIW